MNKKSRIKTTLDSLFTGGKLPVEETKTRDEKKSQSPKPQKMVKKTEITKKDSPVAESLAVPAVPEAATAVVSVHTEQVELNVKENTVEIPVEKPAITLSKPVENNPQVPAVPIKKPDEDDVLRIARDISQASQFQNEDEEHLVIFTLGKELYGVTIHSVESIIKLQAITEVPRTASFILGVTNLRGTVVPVLDLRKRFNLASCENTANTRIVIINAEGSKVGIVVDEVTEVLKVSRDAIQPPPPMSTTIESSFINGIARINDRLVILLDLEKVLASSSRQHNR
jgi:purine-binding chemotaxis protein CheW